MSYEHKKQHIVPQSYLKSWCDPNTPKGHKPYVWVFSKDGKQVKNKAPENIFYENDFYTIKRVDGTRDLVLEQGLQELESRFATVRRNVITPMSELSADDKIILCAFTAAMHARTKAQRDHTRNQWTEILDMMKSMQEQIDSMTPEEKQLVLLASPPPPSDEEGRITLDDVERIVESPMQSMLAPTVEVETSLLLGLDIAIVKTESSPGFITSDRPCVWFDPEAYKRPPYYKAPALMYETIEITLPISPNHVLFLNHQGYNGYKYANNKIVDELNRRTRFHTQEYFIVCQNEHKPYWFVDDPRKKKDFSDAT